MPIIVTGRHRPHEVVFLTFSAAIGVAFILGLKAPGSLEALVPTWILWTWYILLLASGVIGLASLTIRDTYRALNYERAAMIGHVAAPALYAVGLLSTGLPAAYFAIAFYAAWAIASGWRARQLHEDMRRLRAAGSGDD